MNAWERPEPLITAPHARGYRVPAAAAAAGCDLGRPVTACIVSGYHGQDVPDIRGDQIIDNSNSGTCAMTTGRSAARNITGKERSRSHGERDRGGMRDFQERISWL